MNYSTEAIDLIRDKDIQILIEKFENSDPSEVALKLGKLDIEIRNFITNQVQGKIKSKTKFPFLIEVKNIIFPPGISLEQSSSQATAEYKSSLVKGNKFIDLTCGFGIDAYFILKNFKESLLVESNDILIPILENNFNVLKAGTFKVLNANAQDVIKNLNDDVDLIFIDPSRRINHQKIFRIEDCEPHILDLMDVMRAKAKRVLIKISPMADISDLLNKIPSISEIHVVSLNNECKEILLFIDEKKFNGKIHCIDLGKSPSKYVFDSNKEKDINIGGRDMKKYMYLPNSSVIKAGAFKSIASDFKLGKISPNTHIYSSDSLIEDFPGKIYRVITTLPYKKESVKNFPSPPAYNIMKRNFPDDVKTITRKLNISPSGNLYIMAYRNKEERAEIAICEKLVSNQSSR